MLLRWCFVTLTVGFGLAVGGCRNGRGSEATDSLRQGHWVRVTTEHFRVFSELDAVEAAELALALEEDLSLIAQASFDDLNPAVEPTDVIIFADDEGFHRFFSDRLGGVAYSFVPPLPERHHTVVTYRELSGPMRQTLRHELVHDIFARNFGAAPPWLNEGFAEYYSTLETRDGSILVGNALPGRSVTDADRAYVFSDDGYEVLAIPRHRIPSATQLLGSNWRDFYGKEGELIGLDGLTQSANYFGAWLLVHFLMDADGPYAARFAQFLGDVRTTSVDHAWSRAFADVPGARLDEDFRAYVHAGGVAISAKARREPRRRPATRTQVLDVPEEHLLLAKLALSAQRPAEERESLFRAHLREAMRADSAAVLAEAFYLEGMVAQEENRGAQAELAFARAVERQPDTPRFLRAWLASSLAGRKWSGEELEKLRGQVERLVAIATAPSEFFLAARFFGAVGDRIRALSLAKMGAARGRVDPWVLTEYAAVLEQNGQLAAAVQVQRRAVEFLHDEMSRDAFEKDLARLEDLFRRRQAAPSPGAAVAQ